MSKSCPFCPGEMVEREHLGVHIDCCPECQGVFFDVGELSRFSGVERLEAQVREASERDPGALTGRSCPACLGSLSERVIRRGRMELCDHCGGLALDAAGLAEAVAIAATLQTAMLQLESSRATSSGGEAAGEIGAEVAQAVVDGVASEALGAAGEAAIEGGGELLSAAAEVGGELFGAIFSVIGSLFEGL